MRFEAILTVLALLMSMSAPAWAHRTIPRDLMLNPLGTEAATERSKVADELDRELLRHVMDADLIVVASVEEVQHARDWLREEGLPDDAKPYREATALVDEVWKGEWTTRVTFRASPILPGDESDARVDERVLLFLTGSGEAAYSIVSLGAGRLQITRLEGGEVVIVRPHRAHDPVSSPGLDACRERVLALVAALED